jgi:hypothetical protein
MMPRDLKSEAAFEKKPEALPADKLERLKRMKLDAAVSQVVAPAILPECSEYSG